MIPFVYCRLAQLYSYAAVNDPRSPAAAANGQYLLIRRDAYEAIGGHAAVRGEVLEDVALARRAKDAGIRLFFAPDEGLVRVRMYTTFRAMWEGWTKNLCPLVTGAGQQRDARASLRPAMDSAAVPGADAAVSGCRRCWVCCCWPAATPAMPPPCAGIVSRSPASYTIWWPCCSTAQPWSASDWHYARGRVAWKGRQYPVSRLGKQDPQGLGDVGSPVRTAETWSI